MRWGCRCWLASQAAPSRRMDSPCSSSTATALRRDSSHPDLAADHPQGLCLCLQPSQPETVHGPLSPSPLQGNMVSAK